MMNLKSQQRQEKDNWNSVIEAVREYKKTATKQKDMDWLVGLDQDESKISENIANTIYPIILKG